LDHQWLVDGPFALTTPDRFVVLYDYGRMMLCFCGKMSVSHHIHSFRKAISDILGVGLGILFYLGTLPTTFEEGKFVIRDLF